MMNALATLIENGLSDAIVGEIIDDLLVNDAFDGIDNKRCCVALAWQLGMGSNSDVSVSGDTVSMDGVEYRVLDKDEKREAWDESLENYLDEHVMGATGPYFDRDAWKRDARIDGAGHCLSSYDGNEYEYCIKRGESYEYWYIYRIN